MGSSDGSVVGIESEGCGDGAGLGLGLSVGLKVASTGGAFGAGSEPFVGSAVGAEVGTHFSALPETFGGVEDPIPPEPMMPLDRRSLTPLSFLSPFPKVPRLNADFLAFDEVKEVPKSKLSFPLFPCLIAVPSNVKSSPVCLELSGLNAPVMEGAGAGTGTGLT